jgi:glutamate carboxypeptidase
MNDILTYARAMQKPLKLLLQEMVECESPSGDAAAINRMVDLLAAHCADIARVKTFPGGRFGRIARIEFKLPGPRKKRDGQILTLGHSDTVWPVGTLKTMPFRESQGRLWGPGVLDMKSGLAFFIYAMRALREFDLPNARTVALWVVPDEEVGSEASRALTEEQARDSYAVLVAEPGTGLEGKLKTARKGVGDYTIRVKGKAAHAGIDFTSGANAILELSRQIERVAGFTRLEKGVTVNPGIIRGGSRTNVVPAAAEAEVDVRVARLRDAKPLDRKFRSLKPFDRRCTLEVSGGLNRPPLERSIGVAALFRRARTLARTIGVDLQESATGGGSDGNFTAALGVPTLDGLGGVGEGAHATNESILTNRIADRVALLALLVRHLGE